eukprot:GILI01021235.1.p2 GENE.GILI01021235.1~~GILI01021235.1.p2  ORF type:complete len:211 (-),score=36.14 GILI01021235.1:1006-1611(-)
MLDLFSRDLKEKFLAPFAKLVASTVSPNTITTVAFGFGLLCAVAILQKNYTLSITFWAFNRFLDGLDGVVARLAGKQSDFGGYYDIITDFTVYGLIPIALVYADPSDSKWLCVSLLQAIYFVNAASLFFLAAILEKRQASAAKKELTTTTMPPGLIEGTETVLFYAAFIVFNSHTLLLFSLFGLGVLITILQRLQWAAKNL